MKKRSKLTKREYQAAPRTKLDKPLSEEQLPSRHPALTSKRHSASDTSLVLYKQLNRVIDVLKYEFNAHAEGPSLIAATADKKNTNMTESSDMDKLKKELEEEKKKTEDEIAGLTPAIAEIENALREPGISTSTEELKQKELASLLSLKKENEEMLAATIKRLKKLEVTKESSGANIGATSKEKDPQSGSSPAGPPPSRDGKEKDTTRSDTSDIPLYDNAVLAELKEADQRAAKAAKAIEAVREQLAVYAEKDEMTEEDIEMMTQKQKELMEKMEEFEEITKKVQHLVGLVDVASSQMGVSRRDLPGKKIPGKDDTLPQVVICGTDQSDLTPSAVVCQPSSPRAAGQQRRYQDDYDDCGTGGGATSGYSDCYDDPCMPSYPYGGGFGGAGGMMGFPGPEGLMCCPDQDPVTLTVQTMNCSPCHSKSQKPKVQKCEEPSLPFIPDSAMELCEQLAATLKISEKLVEANAASEGNRTENQLSEPTNDTQGAQLSQRLDYMKMELLSVQRENQCLKSIVTKGGMGQGDKKCPVAGAQKNIISACCKIDTSRPMCKVDLYKAMGQPVPPADGRPPCPGAKFAASLGWKDNQGCLKELNKSVNCHNPQCDTKPACVCSSKGAASCPVHSANAGRSAQNPADTCSGDNNHGPCCTCGHCRAPQKQCRKADMEAVVQTMEQEVKSLQKELELVQAERRGLALQKKLLNCMADSGVSPNMHRSTTNPCQQSNKPLILLKKPCPDNMSPVELQLNCLREQYRKLQEDYNCKVEEVSMVRVEYDAAKRDALSLLEKCREAEARVDDLLDRLRSIESEKTKMAGSKDQMMELEQQLILAKQRYREGQEELDEIKTTMQDQMLQLEEYRSKYLSAQQTVEEQRRQIDIMELENNRISEQVNLEIQRVKTQFQEKLQELTPLPDMLKATQLKLQECDQLRQLAERNVEQLLNQVDEVKDQNKKLEAELEELKKNSASQNAERSNLTTSLTTGEKKIEEIKSENSKLRATVARLEEIALNNDRRLDEKNHEVLQLQTQLETLREESARQVSRTKDRCENVRRTLQSQISQLECQLAQSRAAARTAQKDRDEIRQRMQAQITSLNDNFEQAQLRIRSLQSHVNYLKSSYTNIFAPEQCTPMGPKPIDGLGSC